MSDAMQVHVGQDGTIYYPAWYVERLRGLLVRAKYRLQDNLAGKQIAADIDAELSGADQPDAALAKVSRELEVERLNHAALRQMLVPLYDDAMRYRRLRTLGCAPGESKELKNGTVLRFQTLDAFVDADTKHYDRGDGVRAADPTAVLTPQRDMSAAFGPADGSGTWKHPQPSDARCPHDGAKCHHYCTERCHRKAQGWSLTSPWEGFPVDSDAPVRAGEPE